MLLGIAYLVPAYGIAATDPGFPATTACSRNCWPRLPDAARSIGSASAQSWWCCRCRRIRHSPIFRAWRAPLRRTDSLPHAFVIRGRRLVFAQGVYALALLTGLLLIIFRGVTDRLIPLYAVGAFLAFTLSQAGMVVHWKRVGGAGAGRSMFLNGLGAIATGITTAVVLVAKFTDGAWITVLLIPSLILMMRAVQRHYSDVRQEMRATPRSHRQFV